MTVEIPATEDEWRRLLVTQLEGLDEASFDDACASARRRQVPLDQALAERARMPRSFLLAQLAQAWGVQATSLKVDDVRPDALRLIKADYAKRHLVAPFDVVDSRLCVAMLDPRDRRQIEELQQISGMVVVPYLAPPDAIRRTHLLYRGNLRELLAKSGDATVQAASIGDGAESAIDLLERILEFALVAQASDVHIEPYERDALVRYRIDGLLQDVLSLQTPALTPLIARIKILASMRIDERRVPQDGRLTAQVGGLPVDLRVSIVPTIWGEKVVMRVLPKEMSILELEHLGLAPADYPVMLRNLLKPFGMILVTGPTGSGKTTTLYAMLGRLGLERKNVVSIATIEDPVEYPMARVCQINTNPTAGLDFASGLRALLRQDPDIIMVGEIRDRETADTAIRCALVGRLLLSTLHTNDAPGAVPRLIDMGVEPFLLASTLRLVVAQRLARRICSNCRESVEIDQAFVTRLESEPDYVGAVAALQTRGVLSGAHGVLTGVRMFRGRGCSLCHETGFRGRIGIFEMLEITESIRSMINERRDGAAIRTAAIDAGMKTMFQDGLGKVFLGETTFDELLRVSV